MERIVNQEMLKLLNANMTYIHISSIWSLYMTRLLLFNLTSKRSVIMAALRSRCRHYIFALWFLLLLFLLA